MLKLSLVLCILVFFHSARDQEAPIIIKRVFEGLSENVDILCNIGRQHQPLYWRIQERIYDLDSVPEFFLVQEHDGLRIPAVDRRLNGWRFQCFAIDFNTAEGMNQGQIIELNVFYNANVELPTADEANLTNPYPYKRPVLDYQRINVDRDYVNFTWKNYREYYPFEVSLYTQNEIYIAESQRDLTPEMTLSEKSIRSTYNQFYFRISVMEIDNLESTSAFYSLSHIIASANSTEEIVISSNGSMASFLIPPDLHNESSLQLVWMKDSDTQCVCPPVERLIAECACNRNTSINHVEISDHMITISNLTLDPGDSMLMHLVSVRTGCQYSCSLKNVENAYRIISSLFQVYTSNNDLCISPMLPDIVYEVNLTDITGYIMHTEFWGISDMYCIELPPAQCQPFRLSINGKELIAPTNSEHDDIILCNCFTDRIQVVVSDSAPLALTLNCKDYGRDTYNIVIFDIERRSIAYEFMSPCNSILMFSHLETSTHYSVLTTHNGELLNCTLNTFKTPDAAKNEFENNDNNIIIIATTIIILSIITAVTFSIIFFIFCNHRSYTSYEPHHPKQN